MIFVDEAKIQVKAGDGGQGCESYYREKYMRYPRPDGGNGGKGGDVIFIASKSVQTLLDYKYRQHHKAQKGGHGSSKEKKGRDGQPYYLKVPQGTIIRDADTDLLIKDLTEDGQEVIVARGGDGGVGNAKRKVPEPPKLGEQRTISLELKLIAEVGLVGFPNAGKSTLISAISRVKSKIANYPFTTKQPILGIVPGEEDDDFIIADLPGLIEGAHLGKGLGDRFLRHAERTSILVHLVDMAGTEDRDPVEDFAKIENELRKYSENLAYKHRLVVANKIDLAKADHHLQCFKRKYPQEKIFSISALKKEGLEELVEAIRGVLCRENSPEN